MTTFCDSIRGLDSTVHALQGRLFLNMSPTAMMLAYGDWACHFLNSPEKQIASMEHWFRLFMKPPEPVNGNDPRFKDKAWQATPFKQIVSAYLALEEFGHFLMSDVSGVTHHHEEVICFLIRQLIQGLSPSNFITTNPEVLELTAKQGGMNLVKGFMNYLVDLARTIQGRKPVGADGFKPGMNLAITPGKVVFKNRLIELIMYSPSTETVYPEPVLIVPAWIMKYYILDLSPENSMVRFLVNQGHTVFIISWKNPGDAERNLSMADYLKLGVIEALNTTASICGGRRVHTVGYCLGGTLLAIACAHLKGQGNDIVRSMTLLAAQTDFTDAGELTLFIDDSQVAFLEDLMNTQNYLGTDQMAGAFRLLRSNDLIWHTYIENYLKGERIPVTDLMAWNADPTRMPYTMHSEYLRSLFLNNDLFEGRYRVDGVPVALSNIHAPVFLVSTLQDHVAPWQSVYKFLLPSDAESVTFVLTSGGHNAGIVSEPGHRGRTYQIRTAREGDTYVDPKTFRERTPVTSGSWWEPWEKWLAEYSDGKTIPPRLKGWDSLADAPGDYVLEE